MSVVSWQLLAGNGQRAMGNGQWAMGNGQWAMGNGQWARVLAWWAVSLSNVIPTGVKGTRAVLDLGRCWGWEIVMRV
ncbi:MAG: hypothetical protein R2848_05730 [Thermomicrobiales bacterium]